ncbi:MAG TPA: DUF58 domain-containing protein [Terriglobia bacterium]|nr:DUF58 domain-containing protein [Terriglobia bacterium]
MAVSIRARSLSPNLTSAPDRAQTDNPNAGWRGIAGTIMGLALSLLLAVSASTLRREGRDSLSVFLAAAALIVVGLMAVKVVPRLVRQTLRQRWELEYEITREGGVYLLITVLIIVASVNTGNNLLFMILAILLAGMLVSGILSKAVLSGLKLDLALPEHVFAGEAVRAEMTIQNAKRLFPSYSLTVTAGRRKKNRSGDAPQERNILTAPAYAPFVPARGRVRERVELRFPRRGLYQEDCFEVSSKFPFSILRRKRILQAGHQILVLPSVEAARESGAARLLARGDLEGARKGQGADLYALRAYQDGDSARQVDWKATAKTQKLMVREFAREEERRLTIFFDTTVEEITDAARERFERAINHCARFVWQASKEGLLLQFTGGALRTPLAPADEIVYAVLEELAVLEPVPARDSETGLLMGLADGSVESDLVVFTQRPARFSEFQANAHVIGMEEF